MHGRHVHIGFLMLFSAVCILSQNLECDTAQGYQHLSGDKCVKIVADSSLILSWHMARDVCMSYGARLVVIKDQYDNDRLGRMVANQTGRMDTSYWIGLSQSFEDSCSCDELKWENGMAATENMGFWRDNQPDDRRGNCVFSQKNMEDYVYDRPYAWSYDSCYVKHAFVCEKMAVPSGSLHCFSGGYARSTDDCNGVEDCPDGSDELDCSNPPRCNFLLEGTGGPLNTFVYQNAQTCTWAIVTPLGSSAFVELTDFQTEQDADYVTVFAGSIIETDGTRIARISGNRSTEVLVFQSFNNMLLLKFSSDFAKTGDGFSGRYGSVFPTQTLRVHLIATQTQKMESVIQDLGNSAFFVGMYDYVYVISTEVEEVGSMITLEISEMMINDDEFVEIFDGESPDSPMLARLCNSCDNYKVIFSTGTKMSLLYRRMKMLTMDIKLTFKYTLGCYYSTTDRWGRFFSPGYPGAINYPNSVDCMWRIEPKEPIAVYFDPDLTLRDDFVQMFNNGTQIHTMASGFDTNDLLGMTFRVDSGILEVRFHSSAIRAARGFMATWSIGCENPNYDNFTISSTGTVDYFYTAKMDLTCALGYAFQQEQISVGVTMVSLECGYKGIWKDYLQIPRCTPVYCGDVPSIDNGYIEYSTGSVYNDEAKYECYPGLTPLGSTTITCQSNGQWEASPFCQVGSCQLNLIPSILNNGERNITNGDGASIGSIIEYKCNAGYEIVGEPIIFCQTNATYTSTSVSCRPLTCKLPMVENGAYSFANPGDFINFGTVSPVQCNLGYTFQNSSISSVSCQADRSVTELPVCVDIDECVSTPCSDNCTNTEGSFYCTCFDGYQLSLNNRNCVDINECDDDIDNCDQACLNTVGSYSCSCALPYVLFTNNNVSGYMVPPSETGYLPTDTLHYNHTCVLIACDPPPEISNGMVLDKRDYHRFGDHVEYQCDIGYVPSSTVLRCEANGQWSRSPPVCTAATCPGDAPASPVNRADFLPGPYDYGEQVYLNCSLGPQRFRHCTYNPATDSYELQGSPYQCDVIDCGAIEAQFNNVVADTTYPSEFVASCASNTVLRGFGPDGVTQTVKCSEKGYWQYGNLQCEACVDPGYPAGGDIVATSFKTNAVVSFICLRDGYTLAPSITNLTCLGSSWSGPTPVDVNGCIDTQLPVFSGICDTTITAFKYELLSPRLQNVVLRDNTGIEEFTVSPINANSTLYVEDDLTVNFTAYDYRRNSATCTVNVQLADETPPTILCPPLRYIDLETETDSEEYMLTEGLFGLNDNIQVGSFLITRNLPKSNFTAADLYETFTYTAQVTDTSNNVDTCKSQVFVRPQVGCVELGYPTPLNGDKVCRSIFNGLECDLSCGDAYTFQNIASQTVTVRCVNGVWDREPIPACVQDRTKPDITCPASTVVELELDTDTRFFDFTSLTTTDPAYTEFDLNAISSRVFDYDNYTFTAADLYQTLEIRLSVSDSAGNIATCRFQYTVLPKPCSPLSLPTPLNAIPNVCTRRSFSPGYDCDLECDSGYVLRGHGYQKTVSCNDGQAWTEVYPACILDVIRPTVECPESQTVELLSSTSTVNVTFGEVSSLFRGQVTDVGGISSIVYSPPYLVIDNSFVNQNPTPITLRATDRRGNIEDCTFEVAVRAPVCSDLSIPEPINGNKTCTQNLNLGWTCTFACDTGYSFVDSNASTIQSTCNPGSTFDKYVPACVTATFTRPKDFIGTLRYQYIPIDNGVLTVPDNCIQSYIVQLNSSTGNVQSTLDRMEGRMRSLCTSIKDHNTQELDFNANTINGTVEADGNGNFRNVTLDLDYRIFNGNTTVYRDCAEAYEAVIENGYQLSEDIVLANNPSCPNLQWNNVAIQLRTILTCSAPYFEYLQNNDLCVLCPAGTYSNSVTCLPCPIGTYRMAQSLGQCVSCPNGGTTYYPGATSQSQCIATCPSGQISPTGFEPCYSCVEGYYAVNATYCQKCAPGFTTTFPGASSNNSCIAVSSITPTESCALGTEPDGNGDCDLCDFGTYRSSSTQSTCTSCLGLTTTYIQGAVDQNSCKGLCGGGLTSSDGKAPCTACPKGFYYFNSTYCAQCGNGLTTEGVGSLSSFDCRPESVFEVSCPRGTYRNSTTRTCMNCGIGTFQDFENQFSCRLCSTGTSTYVEGAVFSSQCFATCEAGFRSDSGLSPCVPCGVGNYWVNSTTCSPCPNGGTTSTDTAMNLAECIEPCPAGFFSYNGFNQNSACRPCPRNHYQGNTQSMSCDRCPDNTYSLLTGQTSDAVCQNASVLCNCNGGTCNTAFNGAFCDCPQGTYGSTCSQIVNYCNSNPCYNDGLCSFTAAGHTCDCRGLATGDNCETLIQTCDISENRTCQNGGDCINRPGDADCLCPEGVPGDRCQADICSADACNPIGTVQNGCADVSFGSNLRRECTCLPGYEGQDCSINTNDCASNPCINGGNCQDRVNGFLCQCINGYFGTYCENRPDRCANVDCGPNSMCSDNYKEESYHCVCAQGYAYGYYTQYSIQLNYAPASVINSCIPATNVSVDDCRESCSSSGSCAHFAYQPSTGKCCLLLASQAVDFRNFTTDPYNLYTKMVILPEDDFYTMKYDLSMPTPLARRDSESRTDMNNVYGLNICLGTEPLAAECCIAGGSCESLPADVSCTTEGVSCNGLACENTDFEVRFKCGVQRVFKNRVCTRKNDYCSSSPCVRGSCANVFKGYRCTCPPGYTGLNCQTDIDNCATMPCQNGATCTDAVNSYICNCTEGYTGFNCQSRINYCANINCNFRGSCENLATDYRCNCQPGYEGKDCENQTDLCLSNPCLHGSTCTPVFNNYLCECMPGWTGKNCDVIMNNCATAMGQMCQADCKPIFNNYYCECPDNTYGMNCENQPNPCQDYNKCQNGATCSMDQDMMMCDCPIKYTGDGCQILVNHCGLTNNCQNGAQCSVTADGYQCSCQTGYNGTNCENDINECIACPGGGQCFDAVGKYYCRCPLNKTGEACSRDLDPAVDFNYDLYFTHPKGYAWIPYPIRVVDADSLSLSTWVRYSMVDGQGVYLTHYFGDDLSMAVKFLELNDQGVVIYGPDPNNKLGALLQLQRNDKINDGNWHLVTFTFDLVEGMVQFYMDTIFHDELQSNALKLNVSTFNMWVILGCEFDAAMQMCTGSNSFHGYLSQVSWYRKELEFNDIRVIFQNVSYVFYSDVFLVWKEYVLESGVDRVIPSEASGIRCAVRETPCRFFTAANLPMVSGCPSDVVMFSTDRLTPVMWSEPSFTDLGATGQVAQVATPPGSRFPWGIHDIVYVGTSENSYQVYCSFRIYVHETKCPIPDSPFGGRQPDCVDNDPIGRTGCRISCYDGDVIDRYTPDLFTCGPSGSWNYAKRFQSFRFPSCGEIKETSPKVRVVIGLVYFLGTTACDAVRDNLEPLIRNKLVELPGLNCLQLDCSDANITIVCGNQNTRRKRQADSLTTVQIELQNLNPTTTFNSETLSIEEYLTFQALEVNVFDFPSIINNGTIVESRFTITANPVCGPNQVILDGQCIECGAGNFFQYTDATNTTAICQDCPIGTYQNLPAQTGCIQCLDGQTTELPGNFESTSCKESCRVGFFFNKTADACSPCPVGFYQDTVGQFRCKPCDPELSTESVGTNSSTECKVIKICESGEQLSANDTCELCPRGFYRNASESQVCVPCPAGFITPGLGGKYESNCTVAACEPGNSLNTITNVCDACPIGTYQNLKWQTSCLSCGDASRFTTLLPGRASQDDCLFYCPPGFEVIATETCNVCDFGFYKLDNLGPCLPCPSDYTTPRLGSTSPGECNIFKCPVGFAPNSTNDGCSACPLGEYQDVEFSQTCKMCPDGESTRSEGSTSPTDCEVFCLSGQEKNGSTCIDCLRGFYKSNMDGLFSMCQSCPENYTTTGIRSISADNCTVRACPPGSKRNMDDTACDLCPLGTYQPLYYQQMCLPCDPNTSTREVGAVNKTQCETYCPGGFEKNAQGGCDACARGYYKDNDDGFFGMCQLCPIENITETTGSDELSDCNIRNCSAGQRLRTDINECEICPIGTYQPVKWQTECISCVTDKTTISNGSTSIDQCILACRPGFEDKGGVCQPCPIGFYRVENATAVCTRCENNTITEAVGANSSDLCNLPACGVGTFLDKVTDPQNPVCKPCAYDFYQDEVWQESCKPCTNGRVTLKTGATMLADCVDDCPSGQEYDMTTSGCEICGIGYYRDRDDRAQTGCQLCDIEFITPTTGSQSNSSCTIANCTTPGYFRDPNENVCKICPAGQYNSVKWSTFCENCTNGFSTRNPGASSVDDCIPVCPVGKVLGQGDVCEDCPIGFYRDSIAVENCTQCPNGLLTPTVGSDSTDDCSLSPCSAGEYYITASMQCRPCPIGRYQPAAGAFECIQCENGYSYTPSEGSTSQSDCNSPCAVGRQFNNGTRSCDFCPVGFYQDEANQFVCKECPSDRRITAGEGSTDVAQCLTFCDDSVNPCSANATCTVTDSGANCECFTNHDDIGALPGRECIHKCDRGYCQNNAACTREPIVSCQCSSFFEGDQCQSRIRGEDLDDDTKEIVIPVVIAAGGLILFLIILAVCFLCWRKQNKAKAKAPDRYSEFNGDRVDKASMRSYDYGQRPYNGGTSRLMLAPYQDVMYDNEAYVTGTDAGGSIDTAVYQA